MREQDELDLQHREARLHYLVLAAVVIVLVLWLIHTLDTLFDWELVHWGVKPREAQGLVGVVLAPWIHGSWQHLLANSPALFILLIFTWYRYPRAGTRALVLVYLLSGLGVWWLARDSYHIGASGLTHGLMFFVFVSGILRRDRSSMALAMITFFLYGGMIWSIFPTRPGISFEYHFFGAASGVLAAFILRGQDRPPPREPDPEWLSGDDPVIGDAWKIDDDEETKHRERQGRVDNAMAQGAPGSASAGRVCAA